MEAAVVLIGTFAVLATLLAILLIIRTFNIQNRSQNHDAIDHQITEIRTGIDRVSEAIQNLNVDRGRQAARLEEMLTSLNSSSSALQNILANTQSRGQWGERMLRTCFESLASLRT